jgi:hypothetical protein
MPHGSSRALRCKNTSPIDALVLLSEVLNLDFAPYGLDAPLSDTDLAAISGSRAIQDRVIRLSGKRHPTTRDFITHSGRGTLHELPLFVGTPQQVADGLEEWFTSEACDGFVLAATHIPGAYEDFVRLVVPELQRRGLFTGSMLASHCARTWDSHGPNGAIGRAARSTGVRDASR